MEELFPRIKNYNVSVKETGNRVIFLRKLQRGGVEHSFGIHVARMAGMPQQVVQRADELLKQMETSPPPPPKEGALPLLRKERGGGVQLSFFQLDDPVLVQIRDELKNIDINALSPLAAFDKLREIKKISGL
jgi:DNA mismatch repair protein MutS